MGANAVTTVPVYVAGEVLTAADLNITNSGIPVFADSTDRDNSFGGTGEKTLAEGQFTNFTLGNGTIDYANYVQVDDFIQVSVQVTLGSTSVMGSDPTVSLPVTSAVQQSLTQYGSSLYLDTGTQGFAGFVFSAAGQTTAGLGIANVTANFPTYQGISATSPFTWVATDVLNVYFTYTI
jgi:hypothetical protein